MSNNEFSHKVLSMILEKRDKGSVSRYLDKLNQFVIDNEVPEQVKNEIIVLIKELYKEEEKLFRNFSQKVDSLIGNKVA